jgi:hypothetical protein
VFDCVNFAKMMCSRSSKSLFPKNFFRNVRQLIESLPVVIQCSRVIGRVRIGPGWIVNSLSSSW